MKRAFVPVALVALLALVAASCAYKPGGRGGSSPLPTSPVGTTSPTPAQTPTPSTSPSPSPSPEKKGPNVGFYWKGKPAPRGVLVGESCDVEYVGMCVALISGDFLRHWRAKPGEEIEFGGRTIRPWFISFRFRSGAEGVATFFWTDGDGSNRDAGVFWIMGGRFISEDPLAPSAFPHGEGRIVRDTELRVFLDSLRESDRLERGRRIAFFAPLRFMPGFPTNGPAYTALMSYNERLVESLQGKASLPEDSFGWMGELYIPLAGEVGP